MPATSLRALARLPAARAAHSTRMMRKITITSILAFAACVSGAALPGQARSLSDDSFVRQALHADLFKGKQAEAALKHVRSPEARAFAHMILTRNTASEQSLRSATHASGLVPHIEAAGEARPPSSAFSYFEQTAKQQRIALRLFRDEARRGDKPALRAYAQARLPFLQSDLIAAERGERHAAVGFFAPSKRKPYLLPAPWPSITPMRFAPTIDPEEEE
jgi:predicted outer membrane protein